MTPCTPFSIYNGGAGIICGRGVRAKRCRCRGKKAATLLCDWKVDGGTCDAALCQRCTYSPAPGKDLCPKHAQEWKQRQEARA